jgi:hypothetical protein
VLGDKQDSTAPFAADREPLDEPERDEQPRSPVADLGEGRQAAHQECRDTYQEQAELEQLLAAELVAVVSEHHATDRTCDEADRVRGEGEKDRVELAGGLREEDLVEHQRRGRAVEKELVPLDDGACHRCDDDAFEALRDRTGLVGPCVLFCTHRSRLLCDAHHIRREYSCS